MKAILNDLVNLENQTSSVNTINANNAVIETAFENTLSRDGTSPNEMEATLDMNSNRIINLPAADTGSQPATKAQLDAIGNGYLGNNILVGTSNEINVSSASGTSTFSLPSSLTFTGKTITGGTFTNTTLSGTPNAVTSKYIADGAQILNATDYGVGTAAADNGPAINALIASLTHGGVIDFPVGVFNYSTPINMNSMSGVILRGKSGLNGGGPTLSCLNFTGTGAGNGITMNSAVACELHNLQISSTDAGYSGFIIKCSKTIGLNDPSFCRLNNCTIISHPNTCNGVDIDASETFSFYRTTFNGLIISIRGKINAASFQVGCYIDECLFYNGASIGYIFNPDDTWKINNCIFERNIALQACGIRNSPANPFKNLTITNCWFGDVEATGGEWMALSGEALIIEGNYLSSNGIVTTNGIDLDTVNTAVIKGNKFEMLTTAIGWAGTNVSCDIEPNEYLSCTNIYSGSPPGYGTKHLLPNGMLMQYGSVAVTTGTPVTLTYPAALTANPSSIVVSLSNPSATTNVASVSSVGSTACTVSVGGTAGANTVYYTIVGKFH